MKKIYPLFLLLISLTAQAQKKSDIEAARPLSTTGAAAFAQKGTENEKSSKGLLDFYIPTAILAYGIEPASVSKVTFALADTKFSLKYGFGLDEKKDQPLRRSIGFQLGSKAVDGVRTLFNHNKTARDFTISAIYTDVVKDISYVKDLAAVEKEYTSNWAQWVNATLNANISQKYVFTGDTTYTEYNNLNMQFLISFTNYFNSLYGNYKYGRNILNIGLGYGKFDNYEGLSDYTLRKSVINVNNNYVGESKATIGKKGVFERTSGLIGSASVFYPFTKPTSLTTCMIGVNGNAFGIGSSKLITNANTGFFVSKRSFNDDKELKEDFSFGVLAVFGNLQDTAAKNYYQDNFTVVLTAQIPISYK